MGYAQLIHTDIDLLALSVPPRSPVGPNTPPPNMRWETVQCVVKAAHDVLAHAV